MDEESVCQNTNRAPPLSRGGGERMDSFLGDNENTIKGDNSQKEVSFLREFY